MLVYVASANVPESRLGLAVVFESEIAYCILTYADVCWRMLVYVASANVPESRLGLAVVFESEIGRILPDVLWNDTRIISIRQLCVRTYVRQNVFWNAPHISIRQPYVRPTYAHVCEPDVLWNAKRSLRQHTSAYAYVSIRQHTSAHALTGTSLRNIGSQILGAQRDVNI